MKSIQGLFLGVIAFVAFGYAVNYGVRSVVTSASTNRADCLSMVGNTTREENGQTYIVGSIRSECSRRVGQVTISFQIDRPAGSNLGRSSVPVFAYSSDVEPGETRQFKTLFPVGKDTIYRYGGMTAY